MIEDKEFAEVFVLKYENVVMLNLTYNTYKGKAYFLTISERLLSV